MIFNIRMVIDMRIKIKENQLEAIEGINSEYPYVLHHVNLGDTKVPWHWHEELEFVYVINGSIKLNTTGKSYYFQKNEAFFINANVLCTMENVNNGQPGIIDSHLFHSVFLSGHFKSIFETKYVEPVLQNKKLEILAIRGENTRQHDILAKLRKVSYLQKKENSEFQTRNLFSDIWILLLDEIQNLERMDLPAKQYSQERIQSMMSYIQQNYQNKISLEDIASSASVSKRECLRCFQISIHKTPFAYLMDYRIEMAEKLLKTTDLSVIDIALQTGFSNGAYFGMIFKKNCGITPGEYRKKYSLDDFIKN